ANLVDTDTSQVVEAVDTIELTSDNALDDLADGDPADAHELGDGGLVVLLGEVGRVHLEWPRESRATLGPGHSFDLDAALGAGDPADGVANPASHAAEVQVSPDPLTRVVARTLALAVPAARDRPRRPNVGNHALCVKFDGSDDRVLDGDDGSEYSRVAHGSRCGVGSL